MATPETHNPAQASAGWGTRKDPQTEKYPDETTQVDTGTQAVPEEKEGCSSVWKGPGRKRALLGEGGGLR